MQRQWRRIILPSCRTYRATCPSPHLESTPWRCTWRRSPLIVAACKRATSHRTGLTSPRCELREGHCRIFLELCVNLHHKHAGNPTTCLPHSPPCSPCAPKVVPFGKPFGRRAECRHNAGPLYHMLNHPFTVRNDFLLVSCKAPASWRTELPPAAHNACSFHCYRTGAVIWCRYVAHCITILAVPYNWWCSDAISM